jgi:hypothetical protein
MMPWKYLYRNAHEREFTPEARNGHDAEGPQVYRMKFFKDILALR